MIGWRAGGEQKATPHLAPSAQSLLELPPRHTHARRWPPGCPFIGQLMLMYPAPTLALKKHKGMV